ncbi:hypothetical protein E4U61_004831 [Claviceps capensis]|nr:hypothetical protein E4U61_004831 [Claviceps capensis]
MDGDFVFVRTWQGSILVSTSLLPRSFDPNSSHPDSKHPYNNSRESQTASRLQHRNSSRLVTAPPPPVPNYWHHRPHAAAAGGNAVDCDENFFYAPSPSISLDSTASNPAQMYSPVYTPRTDDDAASIPDAYPSFSPPESVGSGFSHNSPGPEWGDTFVATDSSLFPAAQCYCSISAMGLPSASGSGWSDDGKTQSFGHEQNLGLPLAWNEFQGSAKTPNLRLGSMY